MNIRVEFENTEPRAGEGVYVYDTGNLDGTSVAQVMREIEAYILRSLAEMNALVTKT